jgi:predicted ABC-type ATPase
MERKTLGLRAIAELRELQVGLESELHVKRTWVGPYTREDGVAVAGYWREGAQELERGIGEVTHLPGERPPWNPPLNPQIRERIRKEGLNDWPPRPKPGSASETLLKGHIDTQDLYSREYKGKRFYSRDKVKEHNKIIDHFLGNHQPQDEKVALFMAGGSASGKSTALKLAAAEGRMLNAPDAVMVNADDIKEEMQDYKDLTAKKDAAAAAVVHEESSDISKQLLEEAMSRGLNVIIDGTGDSGGKKFMDKIYRLKDEGYKIKIFMVDLPTNIAIERAVKRGDQDGRYIAESEIRRMHNGSAANHLLWRTSPVVDEWQVWSNNVSRGEDPILAAEGGLGKFKVDDDYEYSRIEQKGTERVGATQTE